MADAPAYHYHVLMGYQTPFATKAEAQVAIEHGSFRVQPVQPVYIQECNQDCCGAQAWIDNAYAKIVQPIHDARQHFTQYMSDHTDAGLLEFQTLHDVYDNALHETWKTLVQSVEQTGITPAHQDKLRQLAQHITNMVTQIREHQNAYWGYRPTEWRQLAQEIVAMDSI